MRALCAAALVAAMLAGCGGDDEKTTATTPPDTRSTTDLAPPETDPKITTPEKREPVTERPRIEQRPIPYPAKRKQEMAAYAQRHYDLDTYKLVNPKVIVEHITVTDDFESVYNTFAADVPDVELGELPGVCSHFVVDTDGTIYQLVPVGTMCRHTVGLNYTSIGIEHVARTDADLLGNARQMRASIALTRWLRCRHQIAPKDVIGHNESLSSPYHQENVERLKTQTHGDMTPASMRVYRRKLGKPEC